MPLSTDTFARRHLGNSASEVDAMLAEIGASSMQELINTALPASIQEDREMKTLPEALTETQALKRLKEVMDHNTVARSFIGMGYSGCFTPPVIQRNILENPGWYTAYTPYQAEIAQGRLEALLNFQTLITDLTGLDVANASLLDEGTAAAEAMHLCAAQKPKSTTFFISEKCHPQTIDVVKTRAEPLEIKVIVGDHLSTNLSEIEGLMGVLVQYPDTEGSVPDYTTFFEQAHDQGALTIVAADLLSLVLLKSPGSFGADIAVGNSQRFGVPLGFGGPHAAFIASKDALKRKLPGRIVGVSHDSKGRPAYRLSLQTREQHIRRDRATSNICTAQVLLGVMASMYAVYHGPEGLRSISTRVHSMACYLADALEKMGNEIIHDTFFDTLLVKPKRSAGIVHDHAAKLNINFRDLGELIGISMDETTTPEDLVAILKCFGLDVEPAPFSRDVSRIQRLMRADAILEHEVFHLYHTETEMLRYLKRLESKDLALNVSMIPLGSCTMKLNATSEMLPLSWPSVSAIHPFAPPSQWEGYRSFFKELEDWLADITHFAAVSLQPNAGSQGEYAGLLAIRGYHKNRGDHHRNICLIPTSAHGTNPASAVMAGLKVVGVACDDDGNIDIEDLRAKAEKHAPALSTLMITYPSTHGVFEEGIVEICQIIHDHGGQVYMDGANMNAQVGLTSPGKIGADVCHLNLHKTFCIPHGGGGPGVGPIGVARHLAPFLPSHQLMHSQNEPCGPVCSAPWGSASILTISWMYIAMMGARGLTEATNQAILNANYIAKRLEPYYDILYKGSKGLVAHECILDVRPFKKEAGVDVEDIAKRLIDYGYHAPTMSWPVPGTLMIEPTESESKAELDQFCDAMISIHGEIRAVINGEADREDNVLKNAPHPAADIASDNWTHSYSRESAAYPNEGTRRFKFWPVVSRIDNVHGDRNLICTCPSVSELEEESVGAS